MVVDEHGRLLGTVSEGDVRRALLSGSTLDDPIGKHLSRSPAVVDPSPGRAEVPDLMRAAR